MSKNPLAVEAIFVEDSNNGYPLRADSYLSSLSDTEYTELRARVTRGRRNGNHFLFCGDCTAPVFARESKTGRRHCVHFGTDATGCRWSSAVAGKISSIDASKFRGNQEGEHHKRLKATIAEIISFDPTTKKSGIFFERYTKGVSGDYAYPDVSADNWQGSKIVFEIQLASTHVPVITKREDFYAENNTRLCWIVGGDEKKLARRTFKDIYFRNDGQILGVDEEVLGVSRQSAVPHFWLFRLLPASADASFEPTWKKKIVSVNGVDWGDSHSRPKSSGPSYNQYLSELINRDERTNQIRDRFFTALKIADEDDAKQQWNMGVELVGGLPWQTLPEGYGTIRALGVLASIQEGRKLVPTKINISNTAHLVNSMLLEPIERRCWTHAFELIAKDTHPSILMNSTVMQKCSRNKSEHLEEEPIDILCGPVFNLFFPRGAFDRLRLVGLEARSPTMTMQPDS